MKEEVKSTVIFSFLIFWTFCFLNGFFNPSLSTNKVLFYSVEFLFWVLYPISNILFLIYRTKAFTFNELGFKLEIFNKKNLFLLLGFSILFSLIIQFLYFETYSILSDFFKTNYLKNFDYQSTVPKTFLTGIIITFYYAISAGFVEEIYYRAILGKLFQIGEKFNVSYILISSLLFSLNHWEGGIVNLIDTFLYGLTFSIFFNKYKNVWPLIIAHILTDVIAFYPNY